MFTLILKRALCPALMNLYMFDAPHLSSPLTGTYVEARSRRCAGASSSSLRSQDAEAQQNARVCLSGGACRRLWESEAGWEAPVPGLCHNELQSSDQ